MDILFIIAIKWPLSGLKINKLFSAIPWHHWCSKTCKWIKVLQLYMLNCLDSLVGRKFVRRLWTYCQSATFNLGNLCSFIICTAGGQAKIKNLGSIAGLFACGRSSTHSIRTFPANDHRRHGDRFKLVLLRDINP